jgi:PAS domain S-box-containing protein
MSFIAIFDLISIIATIISIFILMIKWKRTHYPDIRYLLLGLLILSFFYYLFLFIEWSGITNYFEKTEDLLGAMIPMFWAFIFYTFLQLLARKDLQNSEEKYRKLIQNSGDIVFLLYENHFEVINKKFDEIFKLTIKEVNQPDFKLNKLFASKSHFTLNRLISQIKKKEKLDPSYNFTVINSKHEEIEVEASFNYIKYRDGIAIQGIMRDITERKRLEEQLRQSQKMEAIGQLAGGIAHDFNNMLTVINGYSEILLKKEFPAEVLNYIQEIRKASIRATRLTSQLLAFSRKQIIQPKIINLNQIITDQIQMLRRLLGEDVEISTYLDPQLYSVKADIGQIEQIIMNIVINARDAMPLGGKLTIETGNVQLNNEYKRLQTESKSGDYAMLSLSDTGIGMDEVTRSRIFEPFYTTKGRDKGTGLGLATVYGIIKQNNGFIDVYSEIQNGSTFKIYLPVDQEKDKTKTRDSIDEIKLHGKETILLVEDDDGVRAVTESTLKKYGYNVISASNGEDAIRIFEEHNGKFDLLLTDVIMPSMGGRELAEKLLNEHNNLKVLYFSGYTDDSAVQNRIISESMEFIQKPYTQLELAKKIRSVIER